MSPIELKFLTDDSRLVELARLYWELDGEEKRFPHHLKDLAPAFSLPASKIPDTVRESCEALSPAIACGACGHPRCFKSRHDFSEAQRHYRQYGRWKCGDCYLEEERGRRGEERRHRELAEQQALALSRHRRVLVEKAYERQEGRDYLLPTELSLTSAVYLLSAMKAGGRCCPHSFWERLTEEEEEAEELDAFSPQIITNISPTQALDAEILDRLKARGLAAVSLKSEPEAFEFYEDTVVGYAPEKVLWQLLPDVPADERPAFISRVGERLARREHRAWHDEWPRLWKEIAAAECIQFLVCELDKHRFSYTPDEQAAAIFGDLVEIYSLAQMFLQIAKAAKDFAEFSRRQRWPMRAGRALEQLRRNVEFYRSRGCEIYAFRYRPSYPARSAISNVFFDTVLGVGADYFFKAPKDIELPAISIEGEA
jgi:hypothetical protein